MTMELVDATTGTAVRDERDLHREVRQWVGSAERAQAIDTYMGMTGCSPLRAAEFADQARAVEYHEARRQAAEDEARREQLESLGGWLSVPLRTLTRRRVSRRRRRRWRSRAFTRR